MSDAKELAKKEAQSREVQKDLRQFLKLESGLGNSPAFIKGHDRIFGSPDIKLDKPLRCESCAYVAETRKDVFWHVEQAPGHMFLLPKGEDTDE